MEAPGVFLFMAGIAVTAAFAIFLFFPLGQTRPMQVTAALTGSITCDNPPYVRLGRAGQLPYDRMGSDQQREVREHCTK